MSDEEATLPLFRAPYNRNRLCFGVFDFYLLMLNSVALHRFISLHIMSVPSTESIVDVKRATDNNTKAFSAEFLHDVEAKNVIIRVNIDQELSNRSGSVADAVHVNEATIHKQSTHEYAVRRVYSNTANFLRAWTKAGNVLTYRHNTTEEEKMMLETMLSLEDGSVLQELAEESYILKESLKARLEYDQRYLANKTSSLVNALPELRASFEAPDIRSGVLEGINGTQHQIVAALHDVRDHFAHVYETLHNHLKETRIGFDELSRSYEMLLQNVQTFRGVLESLCIPQSAYPSLDVDSFPPAEFYRPDYVAFPDTVTFLRPLDEFLLRVDADFSLLGNNILRQFSTMVDTTADEVFDKLLELASPDDYDPPAIVYGRGTLTPAQALAIDAEITANLTRLGNLPRPFADIEEPSAYIPTVNFANTSVPFARPTVMLLDWENPNLDMYLLLLEQTARIFWRYYLTIELFFINIYRALRKAYEYFEGTAVPLPIIDLRTKAEKQEEMGRKKRAWHSAAGVVFNPWVPTLFSRLLPSLLFLLLLYVGGTYYIYEFSPNCIYSNNGTSIGANVVRPLLYNEALYDGKRRAADLTLDNQLYIQEQCQSRSYQAWDAYQAQLIALETSRAASRAYEDRLETILGAVNMATLCDLHNEACNNVSSELFCPVHEDGSQFVAPCDLPLDDVRYDGQITEVAFDCNNLPSGEVKTEDYDLKVRERLAVNETWCIVEWWMIGRTWRFLYVVCSYLSFFVAFQWIVEGLRVFLWTKFRPAEFQIRCMADRKGFFTQDDYSDVEAKESAISEWVGGNRWEGLLKLFSGLAIVGAWTVMIVYTASIRTSPVWFEEVNP